TGVVWLVQNSPFSILIGDNTIDTVPLDAKGGFSGVTHLLPGGTYQISTHYPGDGTFAASDSSPPVQVTVAPETTSLTFSVLTMNSSGILVPLSSASFGTPVYFQAQLHWPSGFGAPTAYVNFYDNNGAAITSANVDRSGLALSNPVTWIPAGSHSITTAYYGDNSSGSSSDLTPIPVS